MLYLNLWFLKFGTDDKPYAAALVLATVLLLAIIALVFLGTLHGSEDWNSKAFSWLTGTFLFVAGIALGKGGSERERLRPNDEDP